MANGTGQEHKPFLGKRIVVTRARSQASELSRLIEELGGEAFEFPLIRTAPPDDFGPLDNALGRLGDFDWLIFTSGNGVEMFFERLKAQRVDIRQLAKAKIAAVGSKTANKIEAYGLLVDVVADEFKAEGLVETLGDQVQAGHRVLFPRANIARKIIPDLLREKGVLVTEVDAYQTLAVTDGIEDLYRLLQAGGVHAITFTSASTVKNFCKAFEGYSIEPYLAPVTLAVIGPVTAEAARERGLEVDVVADTYTIQGLIDSLIQFEQGKEDTSHASI